MIGTTGWRRTAKFTCLGDCAYMSAMALPALQETFQHLSAATRTHPATAARGSDVVSFTMANIIKLADDVVDHQLSLRALFVEATDNLNDAVRRQDEPAIDRLDEYADALIKLKRACREYARSDDHRSIKSLADTLRSIELTRPADGRLARQQAERIDESAELCEAERVKFVGCADHAVALMEAKVAGIDAFAGVLKTAIARQSIERFPVVNDYLAR